MTVNLLAMEEEVFKVIASQKRLEIILLLENRELNVSQMGEMLGLRQTNLSQHLALLRQQRLVEVNKKGRQAYYRLTDQSIAKSIRLIHEFLRARHRIDMPLNKNTLFPIVADPICGMRFSASQAVEHITLDNTTYYFCASGCKAKFLINKELSIAIESQTVNR